MKNYAFIDWDESGSTPYIGTSISIQGGWLWIKRESDGGKLNSIDSIFQRSLLKGEDRGFAIEFIPVKSEGKVLREVIEWECARIKIASE